MTPPEFRNKALPCLLGQVRVGPFELADGGARRGAETATPMGSERRSTILANYPPVAAQVNRVRVSGPPYQELTLEMAGDPESTRSTVGMAPTVGLL